MPSGKVKWFDAEKGFGFLSSDDGADVYVHADALPAGVAKTLKAGTRVEFGIAQGRRGGAGSPGPDPRRPGLGLPQRLCSKRRKPEEMELIVENVIKLLDDIREGYAHGRPPTRDLGRKIAPRPAKSRRRVRALS